MGLHGLGFGIKINIAVDNRKLIHASGLETFPIKYECHTLEVINRLAAQRSQTEIIVPGQRGGVRYDINHIWNQRNNSITAKI